MINILTIDVEDWYMDLDISVWHLYEDRVVNSTNIILSILDEFNTKATFFIVGYVAEHFPELVENIKDKGHEIATHGYSHTSIKKLNPVEFEKDLLKSIKVLEKITKEKIIGHRACEFSIVEETSWAIDILKKNNLKYDSSLMPVKTYLYGVTGAPSYPYHISSLNIKNNYPNDNFFEFPLSFYQIPILGKGIPITGGFYLRSTPYWFIKIAIKKINNTDKPVICYQHPWEFDAEQPKINGLKKFHYFRLNATELKFKKLLRDFKFTSIQEWMNYA